MDWLNYHHLLYFWSVAKHGTVAKACEELHLAQPTISAQLWLTPTVTMTADVTPVATGVACGVVVPSPSWPSVLSPQQRTAPSTTAAEPLTLPPVLCFQTRWPVAASRA